MGDKGIESTFHKGRPWSRRWTLGGQFLAAVALLGLLGLAPGCSSLNFSKLKFWQRSPKSYADVQVRPAAEDTNRLLQNAHYLTLMGRPELALKELEEAFSREPQNVRVANALAEGYEQVGAYDKAWQVYQQALSQGGDNRALRNNLCYSHYLAGNFKKAEACFREALEQDPENATARNNLGLLLCRTGRQEEARRLWQEAEGQAAADQKVQEVLALLRGPGSRTYASSAPAAAPAPVTAPEKPQPPAARPEAKAPAAPVVARLQQERPEKPIETRVAATLNPPVAKAPEKPASAPAPAPKPVAVSTAAKAVPAKPTRKAPLTAAELTGTGIKVENGNGYPDLAHDARTFLSAEGFNVVDISNYIDFGVEDTVVYYRPGAARVAQALAEKFHTANVQVKEKLPEGIDVRVIMGHDLLLKEELLEKLAG